MQDYPSYQAPRADGAWLCEPEPNRASSLIAANQHLLNESDVRWLGIPLLELRRTGRNDLLQAADRNSKANFTLQPIPLPRTPANIQGDASDASPILLSGHQPELFHPGVWFKNFLLSELAGRSRGAAVNVLVDHDLAKRTSFDLPLRMSNGRLTKESVALETPWSEVPWEHAMLRDVSSWDRFVESACEHLRSVGIEKPLLLEMNAAIRDSILKNRSLGEGFAVARHRIEVAAGLSTLEVPFSHLASSQAWTAFIGEFILRADEVSTSYNRARDLYRAFHKIKNSAQPLPPLGHQDAWIETPFWIYSKTHPLRRPLWVRKGLSKIELSDLQSWLETLPIDFRFESWPDAYRKISETGIQIRPRALTTTMFLRVVMCDLFIHGIGGGRYDQLTNQIIRDLWGLDSPAFVVATATSHLPIKRLQTEFCSVQEALKLLRDWRFTPERAVTSKSADMAGQGLLATKQKLLTEIPEGPAKEGWHRSVLKINEQIRSHFAELGDRLHQRYEDALQSEHGQSILEYREFSFALFERGLVDTLQGFAKK